MNVDLAVDVKGIVLKDDPDTADVTEKLGSSTYGQVTYRPATFTPTGDTWGTRGGQWLIEMVTMLPSLLGV